MDLKDLIPSDSRFELKVNDDTMEFSLGKFTIEKARQLNDRFDGNLEKVLNEGRSDCIAIIAWSLMKLESKRELMKIEFHDMDEDGIEKEVCKTGPQKLMALMVSVNDVIKVWESVGRSIGISTDTQEKNKEELKKDKKKSSSK